MKEYKVSNSPNPREWLELDETERLDLVVEFVKKNEKDIEIPTMKIHASIHVIVENQLAMESEPTPETYSRLRKQGLSRHETIHAIGAVISEGMFEIMKGNKDQAMSRYKIA
jgi:hypothetical protein